LHVYFVENTTKLNILSCGDRVPNFHLLNSDDNDNIFHQLYQLFRKLKFVMLLLKDTSIILKINIVINQNNNNTKMLSNAFDIAILGNMVH
jgi:hypothetical protein